MKKFCLLLVAMSISYIVNAQEGIRIGAKGSFSSTWLFNKNVSDQDASLDYASTFSPGFGVQAIMMFTETYGIGVELNYNSHQQKYDGVINDNDKYPFTNEIKLSYIDVPVMFRVSSPKGPYFDIGPQFSILTGAKETFEYSNGPASSYPPSNDFPGTFYDGPSANYSDKDFKDDFKSIGVGAVLGFGIDIKLTEILNLTTGFRFGYQFTDATTEYSQLEIGVLNTAEKASFVSNASHSGDKGKFDYQSTSRAYGGFQLGIQLFLGEKRK